MFQSMKRAVEEKYGRRSCEFTVERVETAKRKAQVFNEDRLSMTMDNNHTLNHSNSIDYDSDHNRTSYNSHTSQNFDATPLTKAKNLSLSVIGNMGITRRRSNVSSMMRNDETRGSMNNSHNKTLNTTMESVADENNYGTTVVVTDSRLSVHNSNSRPSSGHNFFLTTSTPNHSRSPSMHSNRDSLLSNDEIPPGLPPRKGGGHNLVPDTNNDNLSLSNFDSNSNTSGSREDIFSLRLKKKAPPPPPPIVVDNGSETPPTPPRKPPMRLIADD